MLSTSGVAVGILQKISRLLWYNKPTLSFRDRPMSELALQLIREAKEQRLTRLDLGFCGLTTLPEELFELEWLEELIIANHWFEWQVDTQSWDIKQSQNKGAQNQIDAIPYQIRKLTKLIVLIAAGNKILDLKPLSELLQLQTLDLSSNQISDVKPLSGLLQLKKLDLVDNQISDVKPLSGLLQLQRLLLGSNQISDLKPLSGLLQLQRLLLGSNQISDLKPLSGLLQLQTLDLQNNRISNVKPLSGLLQLQTLDLQDNRISDLKPLSSLIEKGLPVSLEKYDSLEKINLHNNPLETPPLSIIEQGNEAILN